VPVGIFDAEEHPADWSALHAIVAIAEGREPRGQLLDGVASGHADGEVVESGGGPGPSGSSRIAKS
jgi:hypothetical protein